MGETTALFHHAMIHETFSFLSGSRIYFCLDRLIISPVSFSLSFVQGKVDTNRKKNTQNAPSFRLGINAFTPVAQAKRASIQRAYRLIELRSIL